LERQKLSLSDVDLIELNEAFAAQVIACDRELQFDPEKLNVNGGANRSGSSNWLHGRAHYDDTAT
jgi:acetyl-CoA C-acetyltransferase